MDIKDVIIGEAYSFPFLVFSFCYNNLLYNALYNTVVTFSSLLYCSYLCSVKYYNMKDSELITEQAQTKEKLARLVDYINSNEYHSLSANKRKAMLNRKVCLEMYLSTLNTEVFEDVDSIVVPDMGWMGVMGYMLSGSIGFGSKFALPDMKAGEVKNES